jgi:hypothetical protein
MGPSTQRALAELTRLLDRVEGIENTVRDPERTRLWRRIGALCAALAPLSYGPGTRRD